MSSGVRVLLQSRSDRAGNRFRLWAVVDFAAFLLAVKVLFAILLAYSNYFPPNFQAGFLVGREAYFWQFYFAAFYLHLLCGPVSLALGLFLFWSGRWRLSTSLHSVLGKTQIATIMLGVVPSGIVMACYAEGGLAARTGFTTLALLTGWYTLSGWRHALLGNWRSHQRDMKRSTLLLCSTLVLRLIGGAMTIVGSEATWPYAMAAWMSWLIPLAANELLQPGSPLRVSLRTTS